MTYKYQLLLRLLWNMSCIRGRADAFTGIVHYHWNRVLRYQKIGALLNANGRDLSDNEIDKQSGYQYFPLRWTDASPIKP